MKARYVLWPVVIFSAVSMAGACSSSDSAVTPGTPAGGADGLGDGGTGVNVGATSSKGATDAGGMSTTEGGAPSTNGGMGVVVPAAGAGAGGLGAGGAGPDLCEGKDLACPDDSNPCTEDECNPATGKCGIPRSATACDDGVYCNGDDTCDAGKCTAHGGNPCTGTCNEAGKYCECASKADCPADELGAWGECTYASTCVESTMRSRTVTTYSCNGVGKCVAAAPVIVSEACTRDTDGTVCLDDGNRCNGTEACKDGNCVPSGVDPCKNNASLPYCYNADPTCRVCKSASFTGSNPTGCASGQYCCGGTCQGTSCLVIGTSIIQTSIIQTTLIQSLAP